MSWERDVQEYLQSLLVIDQNSLLFLHKAVLGQRTSEALEPIARDLSQHVRNNKGKLPSGLDQWLRSLGSLDLPRRKAVIRLVGFYQDEGVTNLLLGVLKQLTYVAVHPAAVQSLAQILGPRASRLLTELLWSAPAHQWHLRETAILRELGRLGWRSSIEHLIRALGVPYENPIQAAAEALALYQADEVLPPLTRALEKPSNVHQGAGAARALGLLGDSRAIVPLQRASRGSVPMVACSAAVALARLGQQDVEQLLLSMASRDRGHDGAEMRIQSFGALGLLAQQEGLSEQAFNVLLAGLKDSQPEVRIEAARALGDTARSGAARYVSDAAQSEVSPLVRSAMIHTLGRLGNTASLPVLLEFLRREPVGVQAEVLHALSLFGDPALAEHISPFRASSVARLAEAANLALRRLLHKEFAWPREAALEEGEQVVVKVYRLEDARNLLLPPPPPPPPPGFFQRLFGGNKAAPAIPVPVPVGELRLSEQGAELTFKQEGTSSRIDWSRRFSLVITREPVQRDTQGDRPEDIGVHFKLRQRKGEVGAEFETIAISLWCAPSESLGKLPAKSERLPCMDPHRVDPFLAALRYYSKIHGEPLAVAEG